MDWERRVPQFAFGYASCDGIHGQSLAITYSILTQNSKNKNNSSLD